jgi:hypothetical protein
MRISRTAKDPASKLLHKVFDVPDVGCIRVEVPLAHQIAAVDATWPAQRPTGAANWHWSWKKILAGQAERFCGLDHNDEVVLLWCSHRRKLLEFEVLSSYKEYADGLEAEG